MVARVIKTRTPVEKEIHNPDAHWYSLPIQPDLTSEGVPDGMVVFLVNIDQIKRAEEALGKLNEALAALFESIPDAMVAVDAVGRIVRVNGRVETMFGYSRKELIDSRSRFCYRNGSGNGTCGTLRSTWLSLVSGKWAPQKRHRVSRGHHRDCAPHHRAQVGAGGAAKVIRGAGDARPAAAPASGWSPIGKFPEKPSSATEKFFNGVAELHTYIRNNQDFIPNGALPATRKDQHGPRGVDGDQVVSKRFVKKQQMQ